MMDFEQFTNGEDPGSCGDELKNRISELCDGLRLRDGQNNCEINEEVIELLGSIVEARNLESGLHIKRVKGYTGILANTMKERYPEYGLTDRSIKLIMAASPLHDIGKIMISDAVLLKPGRLSPEEFEYMKTHTTGGCELLKYAGNLWTEDCRRVCMEITRHHHERWDGSGYPDGLAGDDIPISAQLVSVADAYDALVTERTYKKSCTPDAAYQMIIRGECGKFNPKLIDCFTAARPAMEEYTAKTVLLSVQDSQHSPSY